MNPTVFSEHNMADFPMPRQRKRGAIDKHMFVEQLYAASAIWSGSLLCISSSKRP
jgi:hypothetical protein